MHTQNEMFAFNHNSIKHHPKSCKLIQQSLAQKGPHYNQAQLVMRERGCGRRERQKGALPECIIPYHTSRKSIGSSSSNSSRIIGMESKSHLSRADAKNERETYRFMLRANCFPVPFSLSVIRLRKQRTLPCAEDSDADDAYVGAAPMTMTPMMIVSIG